MSKIQMILRTLLISFYFFDSKKKKNILEFNTHFSSTSLPNSEFGYSIISKLLDIANEKMEIIEYFYV